MCTHCVETDEHCIKCLCRTCIHCNAEPVLTPSCKICYEECDPENDSYWYVPSCWGYEETVNSEMESSNGNN